MTPQRGGHGGRRGEHTTGEIRHKAGALRSVSIVTLVSVALAMASMAPASARIVDQVKAGKRLGPIRFGSTTLRQAKSYFGQPTSRQRMRLGCIRAIRVRWGYKLEVFFTTGRPHRAIEGTVRKRSIRSSRHGWVRFQTTKGLRIRDRNRRIRTLYPGARPVKHRRHWDYFLVSSVSYGRLVAITKTRRGRVAALFAGPYENC